MEFSYEAQIDAPVETVWRYMSDIPGVATCIPGVVRVEPAQAADCYTGALRVRIGPVGLELAGDIRIEDWDDAARSFRMLGEAKDRRVPGQLAVKTRLQLAPGEDEGSCRLLVDSDARLLGKLGEFGQSLIRRKTQQVMGEFTDNLAQRVREGEASGG